MFTASKLNELYNIAELKNGVGFGGELLLQVSPSVSMILHVETFSKAVAVQVESPAANYEQKISSLPVMAGLEYRLVNKKFVFVAADILAGLGLSTQFSSKAKDLGASGTTTTYGGSPLTFMAKLLAEYKLSRRISLGGYAGYRLLKASSALPTTQGTTYTGDGVTTPRDPLLDPVANSFTAQEVSLSGVVLGLSATVRF